MTAYHGGKQRIGKYIAETILDESILIENTTNFIIKGYCEPFCGMLGVYKHVHELFEDHAPKLEYKAGDINKSVVMMWNAAKKGWKPSSSHMNKKEFEQLKYNNKYSAIKGFVGHVYTYRGIFFDGYFNHKKSKVENNARNVISISKQIRDVTFSNGDYKKFSNLKGYVIYCDPPYQGGEQRYYRGDSYKNRLVFDSSDFFEWCREMSENNIVFVSEYKAPSDFKKVWTDSKKENLYII